MARSLLLGACLVFAVTSVRRKKKNTAVLKNCFDWLSRKGPNEVPKETFTGLKSIGISVSTGKNAAKRALERLTVLLKRLGVDEDILTYNLGNLTNDFFDENNKLLDDGEIDTINNIIKILFIVFFVNLNNLIIFFILLFKNKKIYFIF